MVREADSQRPGFDSGLCSSLFLLETLSITDQKISKGAFDSRFFYLFSRR